MRILAIKKWTSKEYAYTCPHMPASVRRHNLARLREELGISQTDLAQWVGRSWSAIKAIETGKLALSPELAALIASTTGTDKNWLLANDLSAPMPPLERVSARLAPKDRGLWLHSRAFASFD